MSKLSASKTIRILNPQGMHARPADLFVRLATRFESSVEIVKGPLQVDGKSILQILTLNAPFGTELTIVAEGPDAEQAVEALAALAALPEPPESGVKETAQKKKFGDRRAVP